MLNSELSPAFTYDSGCEVLDLWHLHVQVWEVPHMTFSKMDIQYTWWNLTKIHQDILKSEFPSPMFFGYPPARFFNGNWSIKAEAAMTLALAEVKCDQILGCKFSFGSWYKNLSDPHFFKVEIFWKFRQITKQAGKGTIFSHKWSLENFPILQEFFGAQEFFLCEIRERGWDKELPVHARPVGGTSQLGDRCKTQKNHQKKRSTWQFCW